MSKNSRKAAKAIEALTDQVEIGKAALMALSSDNRRLAISKLTLNEVLWKIIWEDQDYQVQKAAVRALHNKDQLRELAESDHPIWQLRALAWSCLGDEDRSSYLYALYNEKTYNVGKDRHEYQFSALDQIQNQELLCTLAMETPSNALRERAIKRISDTELLRSLCSSEEIRHIAIKRLWELSISSADEPFLPFLLEHSDRENMIRYLSKLLAQNLQEWLYYCTCETVEKMMRPERDKNGKKKAISHDLADQLISVLQWLYDNDPELHPCIEKFEGTELAKEEYRWVECHNPDDSYGFQGRETLYFKLVRH